MVAVRAELNELTTVRRPYIVEKIKSAREHGDLSENFEYHSAKNEQGFIESRIQELEQIIRDHRLIGAPTPSGVGAARQHGAVHRGGRSRGVVPDHRTAEADPGNGRVSNESAVGKALLGRRVGDVTTVETESGDSYQLKVVAVE